MKLDSIKGFLGLAFLSILLIPLISSNVKSQSTCTPLNITSIGCINDPNGPQNCICQYPTCTYSFYNGQTGHFEAEIYNPLNESLNITLNSTTLEVIVPPLQNAWVNFPITAPLTGQEIVNVSGPEFDLFGYPYQNDSSQCFSNNLYSQYSYFMPDNSTQIQFKTNSSSLLNDAQTALGSLQQVESIYENALVTNNDITCVKASEQLSSSVSLITQVDRQFSLAGNEYINGNYILSEDYSENALSIADSANQSFANINNYFSNCGIRLPYIPPVKITGPIPGQVTGKIYELPTYQNNQLNIAGQPFPLFILEMLSVLLIISFGYFFYKNFGNASESSKNDDEE